MASGTPWHEQDLLAFDLETTGIDPCVDVPVSYALVALRGGEVVERDASLVDPGRRIPAGATAVHGITTDRARGEGVTLGIAVRRIADTLLRASGSGVPVVGMKLDFDLTMLDSCYRREVGLGLEEDGFRGPVLDALVIDRHVDRYRRGKRSLSDLCAHYGVLIEHAHDASADARASADVLRAMCACFPELVSASPAELHVAQEAWNREWTASFAQWRLRTGLAPIATAPGRWPIATATEGIGEEAAV